LFFLLFALSGCLEDKFELERISGDMQLTPEFSAPLVRGSITLEDLVEDEEGNLVIDSSEAHPYMKLVFREDTIFSFDGNDFFEINESGGDSYTLGNISIDEIEAVSREITFREIVDSAETHQSLRNELYNADGSTLPYFPAISSSDSMVIDGDYLAHPIDNFRYASFESGTIDMTITNHLPVAGSFEFMLDSRILNRSGSGIDSTIVLGKYIFTNIPPGGSKTKTLDLAGKTLGSVFHIYQLSWSTPGSSDQVDIDLSGQHINFNTNSSELIVNSGEVVIQDQTLNSEQTAVSTGYTEERRLDTIRLAGSSLNFSIDNNTNIPAYLDITLPHTKDAQNNPLDMEQNIPPQMNTNGELDLAGSETILTGKDSVPIIYNLRLQETQNMVEFDASDQVEFSYNLQLNDNHIEYVSGYFGKETIDIDKDEFDLGIGFFEKISGDFTLVDPELKLFYYNTIGVPISADMNITGVSGDGGTQNLNEGDQNGFLHFRRPYKAENPIYDTITIDSAKTVDFVSLPPRKIEFDGNAYTNYNKDSTIQNFISSDNQFNVGLEFELPLQLKTSGLIYRDSFSFETDFDFDRTVNLYGIFRNGFPFGVDIQVICRDSTTNTDLFSLEAIDKEGKPASLLEAPDINSNGRVTKPMENIIFFKVTEENIDLLRETNQLTIIATVKTTGAQGVKFYTDYTLDFKMGIDETGVKLDL
jgi:hypothetical protein